MKKQITLLILIAAFATQCGRVPITGRKQINMLPEIFLTDMALANYADFKSQNQIINNTSESIMVKSVGNRMSSAVENYLIKKNQYKRIKNYQWEFNLAKDNVANAWCMPGGKVMIYTGILPITKNETGLAVVMGHEIAHAVARHGNERMSQQIVLVMGGIGLAVALAEKPKETQDIFMLAYGVGATVGVLLPFSRLHEKEADKMGLVFMAIAGYDPNEAIDFWKRMEQQGGANIPAFLSTHPSHETRIKELEEYMPVAEVYYNQYKKN